MLLFTSISKPLFILLITWVFNLEIKLRGKRMCIFKKILILCAKNLFSGKFVPIFQVILWLTKWNL